MEVVAATNNQHKLDEIRDILKDMGYKVLSLKDVGIKIDIEENGTTFRENALIKAREIWRLTGKASIADDSGLEVFVLNGEPGVYSARYAGVPGDEKDRANNKKLLENMKDIPENKRQARFVSSIAFIFPDGKEIVTEGYVYGTIGFKEKGENGFGYDPLFIVDGLDKTMAELTSEEKNKISHRANALKELKKMLNQ
ncbi:XTP/dITP diphosphatase [Lutispora thermophila]|uniref:dITP/XTP pyrophosphatase n=1 Tax=Lutispora thermophila DSM 19022 TaxID=1122184 RepID=A0A1M6DT93_9FIRM|nr:XTP/dITP diphosphatase [Lutispora thermophila]SHI76477.1 non-canonical purine NTP pyrophosphatase, RdgB/HAM1 family [Lutispora thermophila DSM 19022]